jgi:hypothetical protein
MWLLVWLTTLRELTAGGRPRCGCSPPKPTAIGSPNFSTLQASVMIRSESLTVRVEVVGDAFAGGVGPLSANPQTPLLVSLRRGGAHTAAQRPAPGYHGGHACEGPSGSWLIAVGFHFLGS